MVSLPILNFQAIQANIFFQTKRELDSSPIEKRAEETIKCWEAGPGQVHCQWSTKSDSRVKRAKATTKCWETPNGQIFCESAADLSGLSGSINKCWETYDGEIHCQWAKPGEVVNHISKCRQAADGQIHCVWSKRKPQPVIDVSHCPHWLPSLFPS